MKLKMIAVWINEKQFAELKRINEEKKITNYKLIKQYIIKYLEENKKEVNADVQYIENSIAGESL
ncbi:MAG: hypothetical protein EOL97_09470 [Spirochaetia bacterium]|nr:hypothetical protein [Tissierellia bacterium]NCD06336.1 hypothetical protein [Spirochaetia bacterium]